MKISKSQSDHRSSVNKTSARAAGRPRGFDEQEVLRALLDVFWTRGYGASIDELAQAAGVKRPTLYAVYGDKRGMYLAALERFCEDMRQLAGQGLHRKTLRESLEAFYHGAIAHYTADLESGLGAARGCLITCTAGVEAPTDPEIRKALARVYAEVDGALTTRIAAAKAAGELPASADAEALGRLGGAVLHSLAMRARAGEPKQALLALASIGVDHIAGAKKTPDRAPAPGSD